MSPVALMHVASIWIYPIKSLDGVSVSRSSFVADGGLVGDRQFALVDRDDVFVNSKRTGEVNRIRAKYDAELATIELGVAGFDDDWERFELGIGNDALEGWFSDFFGFSVRLVEDRRTGFPDDGRYPGPTVVSRQSLMCVASWFDQLTVEAIRRRMRANIEVEADIPFAEDRLFHAENGDFFIGSVSLRAIHACERCVVPTRDPDTGEVDGGFERRFRERRRDTLPSWAEPARYDDFYKLTVNTTVASGEVHKVIAVDDRVGERE
ncbi:MAG: MOSC N-terminal beta barrel domain-containing protein [Pseudomonadota bacterium]